MAHDPTMLSSARVAAEGGATDFRILTEASVDVIWSCDLQMRFTYVSPSVERLLGITQEECLALAPRGTVTPESLERLSRVLEEELVREAREPGSAGVRTIEIDQLHRDGRIVTCEVITSFLRDEAQRVKAVFGVTRDVTERKCAERRLREAEERYRLELQEAMESLERRVRERTAELEAANARLRREMEERREAEAALIRAERLAAVGTLAAGAAHEFNNVHQIVAGWARVASRDPGLSEAGRDAIEHVLAASLRGSGVAENLLTFSSARRGQRVPGSLSELVAKTLDMVRRQFESEGIEVRLDLAPVPETVLDAGQLSQVLLNLLINAQHAMLGCKRRRLTLATGVEGGRVFARVEDTGVGIPEANLPRLFTPFFSTKGDFASGDGPLSRVRGTGLGLSVAQTLVASHDGEITVHSREAEGTRFTVYLPLREVEPVAPVPVPAASGPRLQGVRVLVVEDEPDIVTFVQTVLRGAGAEAKASANGAEALAALVSGRFELVLLDLQMPVMDGPELLRRLDVLGLPRMPRVLVMTGKPIDDDASLSGATVLRKPFDPDALVEAAARLLGR